MKLTPADRKALSAAAMGMIPCDKVFTGGTVVNVFTGELLKADVYVYDGYIAHVEYDRPGQIDVPVREVIDVTGQYLAPGFLDAHIHIESTMMTPRNFAKAVIPHGTTTVITDPHEVGNVFGIPGIRYMHDIASDLPMRQLINIPSCVPAVPGKEFTGADLTAKDILELASLERVAGLAEVMDFFAVIYGEERMQKILEAAESKGLYLQGHSPTLTGRLCSAYLCGGPQTDHESFSAAEALDKYRRGMYIDMRESSIVHNVEEVWKGLRNSRFFDTLCLCTDDREPDDLLHEGHINYVARRAIEYGMDPVQAIKSCTINTAREIRMDRLGAIAPGYTADINVLPDLKELRPSAVYFLGNKVAENGVLCVDIPDRSDPVESLNSMDLPPLDEDRFTIHPPVDNGTVKVNVLSYPDKQSAFTVLEQIDLEVKDGRLVLDDPELKFTAVVNRFGRDHVALAVVKGFGLKKGAVASTVSHDSHNLTIVYDTPENALACANALKECGGGMAAADRGAVQGLLPLPVAGLLSRKTAEELEPVIQSLKAAERSLGMTEVENPLLRITTLALPVVPEVKMTDVAMIHVATKEYLPVFAE